MSFSWAVHVSHEIAASLLRRCLVLAAREVSLLGKIVQLSKVSSYLPTHTGEVVTGHIIDDFCMVGFGDVTSMLLATQSQIWSALHRHGLPLKVSKSTPLGSLVYDAVTFIGFRWCFQSGTMRPKHEASSLQHHSDALFANLDIKAMQRLISKVIWLYVAKRPLLSLLRCTVIPCALDVPSAFRVSPRAAAD